MQFSKRTSWDRRQNQFVQLKNSLQAQASIFDLTVSNPSEAGLTCLNQMLLRPFQNPDNLVYAPDPRGLLKARKAVCVYYQKKNVRVKPEDIFLTAGTSEAYAFIFKLIANPGESILAPAPSYPLFDYLAGLSDLNVERYPLEFKNGWNIKSLLPAERMKAVLTVHPNNPTGHFVSQKDFKQLNNFAREHELAVISDEVFLDFDFNASQSKVSTFAANQEVLTFTLGGISKSLALPQMKLSWMVISGPEQLKREAVERLEVIADTFLSVNTLSQNALPDWMEKKDGIVSEILNRLKSNDAFLRKEAASLPGVQVLPVEGGWYAVISLPDRSTDEEWAFLLLKEDRVFAHPGYFFDFPEGNFIVLSLLTPSNVFAEGVKRMVNRVKTTG